MRRGGTARGALAVAAFTAAVLAPFLSKPFHIDEPLFMAPARHILIDFWHPLAFSFNWYGWNVPMARINNTPPPMLYLLAAGLKATGGSELGMRLLFLPLPILAAVALYLLAARFLERPLLPALICAAGPAFLINMGLLYPEVLAGVLGFWGLYALARGVDDGEKGWFWASAALIAAAILAKYFFAFLLLPAAGFCLHRGVNRRRLAAYMAACLSGIALLACADVLRGGAAGSAAWRVMSEVTRFPVWTPVHKLRSWLCFVGGAGVATAVWPLTVWRPRGRAALALAACAALLFLPVFDAAHVRLLDRLTGVLMGGGALAGFWMLFGQKPRRPGWALWAPWALGASLLLLLYWSIMARLAVFCVPPLVFAAAEELERRRAPSALSWIYGGTLAATLLLSFALARVDYDYARGQKSLAAELGQAYASRGRAVWTPAHWGFQYYLERAGGRELDGNAGGWSQVRPGDVVVTEAVNAESALPRTPLRADVRRWTEQEPIPLRLMSGFWGEGGFYTNAYGFLPYCLSREPLEQFTVAEIR